MSRDASEQHCFELVKAADRDRYLASLFAPDGTRPLLHGLYAFNVELARVRETVSEPGLGEIRHQWWRDALDAIYARDVPDHPVAQMLARAIEAGHLPKHSLMNMIEARRFDLYDDPMPSLNDLEGYIGETSSALIQMGAMVLAGDDALGAAEASGLAGVAYGLAGLLRSLPIHRARGQCYVPKDMLEKRGASVAHVLAARESAGLVLVLSELRHQAAKRLGEARAKAWLVPKPALPAFLPVCLTDLYLAKLAKTGGAALTEAVDISQLRRQWRLYWQARWEIF
jgi:15-cis-phytoene synthase